MCNRILIARVVEVQVGRVFYLFMEPDSGCRERNDKEISGEIEVESFDAVWSQSGWLKRALRFLSSSGLLHCLLGHFTAQSRTLRNHWSKFLDFGYYSKQLTITTLPIRYSEGCAWGRMC